MAFLTQEEKERIADAVLKAEQRTSGELVTVIARRSDDYAVIPWTWASLFALMLPGILQLIDVPAVLPYAYVGQVGLFVGLLLLLQWQPVKIRLVPNAMKQMAARRLAREQFFMQRLHMTRERTGLLIFVSVAEHYVEILADEGINNAVPPGAWDAIVARFVEQVKTGRTAEGFIEAITGCGDYLATHFPVGPDDVNELPNPLVEL